MNDTNKKQHEKGPETARKNAPGTLESARKTTDTTKRHAEKITTTSKTKKALAMLKKDIERSSSSNIELSFTSQEIKKLEAALGIKLSGIDKKTLTYRVKMLSVDELDKAEEKLAGTGARLFTTIEKDGTQKAVPLGYSFQKTDKITVHFRKNEVAEDNYGMRHLFKQQPEIRQVRITQNTKRGKGREGIATRRGLDGNFYFDDGSYAPIFTGTQIEVLRIFSSEELKKYKKRAIEYNTGKNKRYIQKKEADQFTGHYGIAPPPTTHDIRKNKEYWDTLDNTDYARKPRTRSTVRSTEYIPRNEREKQFIGQWREIMSINSKQRLVDMKEDIVLRPDDPIVHVPDERRGTRLRSGAALRYALFKRYAELSGHRVRITSAYRSTKLQRKLWYRGLAKRMKKFRDRYPNLPPHEIKRRATAQNRRFIAPPGRSHHNTGGAVDINISGMQMHKYRGSRSAYRRAVRTGNLAGISGNDRKAVQTRIKMEQTLRASYFLGTNYYRETWHWNVDRQGRRDVYDNV